jgi:anti-anti-sigma factor
MSVNETEHITVQRTSVITPEGRLDAFSAPELRKRLEALLADGVTRVVINLSEVPFLDSAGLAVLVSALKRARQAKGDVKLVWPQSENAQRIIRLTRFDRVFDLFDTAEAALTRF